MESAFSKCHKRHRRCKDLEGWDELLDFCNPAHLDQRRVTLIEDGACYTLPNVPGFYFFPSGISEALQKFLEYESFHVYCRPPFRTNLDLLPATKKATLSTHTKKLSWATLGYHYHWTDRTYQPDDVSTMPTELQAVAQHFARIALRQNKSTTNYQATACIVNYYSTQHSVMGGHRDDVEEAVDQPVVSLSLGSRPGVFLIGGATLASTPVIPMVVRPGDVVVLSGPCRLHYHSLARLLPCELPIQKATAEHKAGLALSDVLDDVARAVVDEDRILECDEFLKDRRININLRQVYTHDA